MNIVSTVYNVPAFRLPGLQGKIEKLNRRCRRLDIPEITMRVLRAYSEEIPAKDGVGFPEERHFNEIEVTGAAPQLHGWTFAATFEHDAETGLTILRRSDAFKPEIPVEYRKASPVCDHCKKDRRRNDTFLVHSDADGFRQIGRNCLKDFLGHGDPHAYASAAEIWFDVTELFAAEDDGEGGYGGGSGDMVFDLEAFVRRAFAVVRVRGFLGRVKARDTNGTATADRLIRLLCPSREEREDRKWREENEATRIEAQDEEKATAALEWIRGFNPDSNLSDYEHNLFVACASELLPSRRLGIVASLPAAYLKHLDRAGELRKRSEGRPISNFVGKVGERLRNLNLTCQKVIPLESDFGTKYLTKFTDTDGNAFIWFSTSWNLDEGKTYRVTGTVKEHDEGDDRRTGEKGKWGRQTILTRCKPEEASI